MPASNTFALKFLADIQKLPLPALQDDTEYVSGSFAAGTQFIANPYLFPPATDFQRAIANWPLPPAKVLNDG